LFTANNTKRSIEKAKLKKMHLVKDGAFVLDTASKFALFQASGLKDEKLVRKQIYTKTETYKLYSGVF